MTTWIEERRKHITATDAANILGIGFGTQYSTWCEKKGRPIPREFANPEAIYWGNRLEPVVIAEVALRTTRRIVPAGAWPQALRGEVIATYDDANKIKCVVVSRELPLLSCTPDAILDRWTRLPELEEQTEFKGPGTCEAKTSSQFMAASWDAGIPLKYQVQGQMQMIICGLEWCCYPVLIGGNDFRIYDVGRNDNFCQQLVQQLTEWWDRYVLGHEQPPVEARDEDLIKALYNKHDAPPIVLPARFADLDTRLEALKKIAAEEKKAIAALKAEIEAAMGDASEAMIEGTSIGYTKRLAHNKGYTVEPFDSFPLKRVEYKGKR